MDVEKVLRERFEAKWKRDAKTGCWLWQASFAGKGYGQIRVPGTRRNVYAHRLSYELYKGPIPPGAQLLHSCDNPACVNPAHLSVGSSGDNHQDMKAKGRHLFGERNKQSRLTEKQVVALKAMLANSDLSQREIAQAFGVSQVQVSRIKRGLRWERVRPDLTQPPEPVVKR